MLKVGLRSYVTASKSDAQWIGLCGCVFNSCTPAIVVHSYQALLNLTKELFTQ